MFMNESDVWKKRIYQSKLKYNCHAIIVVTLKDSKLPKQSDLPDYISYKGLESFLVFTTITTWQLYFRSFSHTIIVFPVE